MPKIINTTARVSCPECGSYMILRRPKPGSKKVFKEFWGCSRFPDCHGTVNIDEDGNPIDDELELGEELE